MSEPTTAETATVLVVDDEPAILGLMAVLLKKTGYHVLASPDPEDALQLCEQYPEPIHLLITDVFMPHMSGRELASQALVFRKDLRVLFMSGYEPGVLTQGAGLTNDTAFLQKPFGPAALLQKVRNTLGSTTEGRKVIGGQEDQNVPGTTPCRQKHRI